MRKTELVVGEEYAVGEDYIGRYPTWNRQVRARYMGPGRAPRVDRGNVEIDGLVFEAVEAGQAGYRYMEQGHRFVLTDGKMCRATWESYSTARARVMAARDEEIRRRERRLAGAKEVLGRLTAVAEFPDVRLVENTWTAPHFEVSVEDIARIVSLIEHGVVDAEVVGDGE